MSAVHDIVTVVVEQINKIRDVVLDPTLEFSRFEAGVARVRLKPRFGNLAFCSSRGSPRRRSLSQSWVDNIYFTASKIPGDYRLQSDLFQLRVSAFPSGAYIGCCTVEFLPDKVDISRFSYFNLFYRSFKRGRHTLSFDYNSPLFIERLLGTVAEFGVGSLVTQELNHKRSWRSYGKKCV